MHVTVSDILCCTDFAGMSMGSTAPSPITTSTTHPTRTNGIPPTAYALQKPITAEPARPTILHLGHQITYNLDISARLESQFDIIRPLPSELNRRTFTNHLRDKTWGNFSAIIKPFWGTGGEMGAWNEELIHLLPSSMKVMAGAGAGFDWVNVNALAERGILYCNGAHASTESVANTALYHLISVFTHATSSFLAARSLSAKAFQNAHTEIPLISHNPSGHTLGIVGLGNIGFAIAKKVHLALGMKILYYDVHRKSPAQEAEVNATFHPILESLLPNCDALLLATPSGAPIITARTLALLPRGARIVNIARGSLIDEEALADALDSGHISAAGLDVHANEPKVNPRFVKMNQVCLTCHTGGASVETNIGFERLVMENVEAVLQGGEPLTAVNRHLMSDAYGHSMSAANNGGVDGVHAAGVNGAGREGVRSGHPVNGSSMDALVRAQINVNGH
ncbi:MAG: hypothetical protein Q9164_006117 [Protoblastenia rupestris]